jgi:hypothetical protein
MAMDDVELDCRLLEWKAGSIWGRFIVGFIWCVERHQFSNFGGHCSI